jgi:protocatechuate 3,4-dioxygenase beta subunit
VKPPGSAVSRRDALSALGAAGAGAAWFAISGPAALARARADAVSVQASACVSLTPEVTAGPYYINNAFDRRDITDGQRGLALRLHLTVQDVSTCKAIAKANVEIWHANAHGVYSGYGANSGFGGGSPGGGSAGGHVTPTNASRYLRGHQMSDANGLVVFDTIYPGWYTGRAPHIHVKVHVGGSVVHTGQLFFDDVLSDAVYRTADYSARGQPSTTDAQDSIFHQEGGATAVLKISKRASGGYLGALTMGVKR